MENMTSDRTTALTEHSTRLKLAVDPLLETSTAEPRLAIARQCWQQEVAELAGYAELVHAAGGHPEDASDLLDRADSREDIPDLERLIAHVRAAQTVLRLHVLVLSDALAVHG
jgi:hypothetical protein